MSLVIAGIGSRSTPPSILASMRHIGEMILHRGWTLRSGGAEGADQAFEAGARGNSIIYVPEGYLSWAPNLGFGPRGVQVEVTRENCPAAFESVEAFHPNPSALGRGAFALMARNYCQIHGHEGENPGFSPLKTNLVICYAEPIGGGPFVKGGTGQAVRIAIDAGIPVWNLYEHDPEDVISWIRDYPNPPVVPIIASPAGLTDHCPWCWEELDNHPFAVEFQQAENTRHKCFSHSTQPTYDYAYPVRSVANPNLHPQARGMTAVFEGRCINIREDDFRITLDIIGESKLLDGEAWIPCVRCGGTGHFGPPSPIFVDPQSGVAPLTFGNRCFACNMVAEEGGRPGFLKRSRNVYLAWSLENNPEVANFLRRVRAEKKYVRPHFVGFNYPAGDTQSADSASTIWYPGEQPPGER